MHGRPLRVAAMAAALLAAPAAAIPAVPSPATPAGAAPSGAAPSAGPASGVIRGQVVDRTPPIHPVAGQRVRLQIVERGSSSERQTRTGSDGAFVFAELPVGGLRVFLVSTDYEGASYEGAQRIVLTPGAPVRVVPLVVYDAGAGRAVLRGTLLFAVVDVVPGALRVTTVEQVQNTADRTIVTTPANPLVFALPAGALDVAPLDGWRDPRVENGRISDARAVTPGVVQLTYAYQERPAAGRASIMWTPPFGAARVEILVSDAHVHVIAGGLREAGPISASGHRYMHWSGGAIAPGGTLSLRLNGLPAAGDRWPGLAAGALAAALAAGLASALRGGWPWQRVPMAAQDTALHGGAPTARRARGPLGEGEPRGGVETGFPAYISPRAAVRRSADPVTEESKAACAPQGGDGAPLRHSPS
jgi:hypothetical protein